MPAFITATQARIKLLKVIPLLAAILLLAAPAFAQPLHRPADARGWSDLVHSRYQNIKSMQATFEQTITHQESGIEEQRTGELYFKKPFLVRWVSNPPYPELIVVEEKLLWQYFPDEELALKFDVKDIDDQSEFLTVLTGKAPLADKFKISAKNEIEGVQELHLLPYSPSPSLVEATIWVDMESGLILRLLFSDFYSNMNDISFTNQELDVNVEKDGFVFTVPPGTMIEDYTQQ